MSTTMYPPESIYNLIPKEEVKIQKPPRHTSRFRPTVVHESKVNKDAMRTMGPAKVDVPSPEKYLVKHSKDPDLPEKKPCSKRNNNSGTMRKPDVPLRTDHPLMGIRTKKDFIKTNVIENVMAVARRPQPAYADTKMGHKQPLENSGLVPKYIKRKDYGETPEYLLQRKEETMRAQEEYDDYVKECKKQGAMKRFSQEERQTTIEGLKTSWQELHHQFQGLSVVTDTIPKQHHKEYLEQAMKQLENDIGLFERHKTIYIRNN